MKMTTTGGWAVRSKATHEILTITFDSKARAARVLKNSGRTDLELVQTNW